MTERRFAQFKVIRGHLRSFINKWYILETVQDRNIVPMEDW